MIELIAVFNNRLNWFSFITNNNHNLALRTVLRKKTEC
jgi:hypothetical protein